MNGTKLASGKISLFEKIGYGFGDTASNLVFQTIVNFIAFYYTDVVGLTPAVVGGIFLVVRVFDAVIDPIMGAIADRTHTRWGQFRPWIVWMAIPFGVAAVLTFWTPHLSYGGRALYALLTYAVLMIFYTAVNIPYGAMAAAITTDPLERTSLQSWRFAMAMVGNLIVSSLTLPLIAYFGQGDRALGYRYTMALFAVLAVAMLVICFASTRERATVQGASAPSTILRDIRSLFANDQWFILAAVNFVLLVVVVSRGTGVVYFVTYVLHRPTFATAYLTIGTIGGIVGSLAAGRMEQGFQLARLILLGAVHFILLAVLLGTGLINMPLAFAATLALVVGIVVVIAVGREFDRLQTFRILFVVQAVAHIALYFSGGWGILISVGLFILVMLLNQVCVPILWSMMADSVDYGEWKTGIRITGLNFSTILFALKLGVAVGGALAAALLGYYGYVANVEQTARAANGIALIVGLVPGAGCLIVAVLSLLLNLSLQKMQLIQTQLSGAHNGVAPKETSL